MASPSSTIRPTPFQARVLDIPEDHNILLGGGRGGGKSFAMQLLILRHCDQYRRDAKVLITRKRLKSLYQFAEELRFLFRGAYGRSVSYNANDSMFRLPNGATVQLAHCESSTALADVAQGMTYSLICVDEAGEGPPIQTIDQLGLALRGKTPLRVVLAANPGGVNHSTLAERYVLTRTPWIPFEYAEQDWVYCPSTIDDNPHLPEAYHRNFAILKKTDPALYHAHRHGDWSRIVGDYFQGVWTSDLILDHHDLPPDCFRSLRLSIDWGSAAPCATVLGGRTIGDVRLPDDRVIPGNSWVIYDEHVEHDPNNFARGTGRSPGQIAPAIFRLCERNHVKARGVIDSAASAKIAGRYQSSITEMFRTAGVRVISGRKAPRRDRHEKLKQLMVNREFWVASRCRFWLSTVPNLPRSPRDPEDVDTNANDHALDATAYLLGGQAPQAVQRGWREPPPMPPDERIIYV